MFFLAGGRGKVADKGEELWGVLTEILEIHEQYTVPHSSLGGSVVCQPKKVKLVAGDLRTAQYLYFVERDI